MYNKILIASALDQGFSDRALAVAKSLISKNGKIIVAHVIEPVNNVVQSFVTEDVKSKTHEKIKNMMAERCKDEAIESEILHGQAGRQISKYAEKIGANCIIIGSHKPGLEDFFWVRHPLELFDTLSALYTYYVKALAFVKATPY